MSTRAISASGARKCSQNWRYGSHGRPGTLRSKESESMSTGRPRAELDVVGGGVAQGHARADGGCLDAQRQQRGVLELAEGPLVGVA